ncbi:1445_t:CDS:2, partial [Ambispora leptoticha]
TVEITVRDKRDDNKEKKISLFEHIAKTCPSLVGNDAKFYPTIWLPNGHFQTAYAAYAKFDHIHHIEYERNLIPTPDGGQFSLDWTPTLAEKPFDDTPTIVVLHGLTGGSHESYIRCVLEVLTKPPHNYRAVVFNNRGCAKSQLLSPQLYCAAYTDDLRIALEYIQKCIPKAKLFAIGFSLGANILLK